jgi:hypothetical protein
MKCKKCGHTARTIDGMRRHYLKAHPAAMKHKGPRKPRAVSVDWQEGRGATTECPWCGKSIVVVKW